MLMYSLSIFYISGTVLKVKFVQSCLTFCDPMDYTVHGILQARILKWVTFPFSRDLPNPGIEVSCMAFCVLIKTTTSKQSERKGFTHSVHEQIRSKLGLPPLYLPCSPIRRCHSLGNKAYPQPSGFSLWPLLTWLFVSFAS